MKTDPPSRQSAVARGVGGLVLAAVVASAVGGEASSPSQAPAPVAAPRGFTPPPPGAMVSQALVAWINRKTGQQFLAPTGGWQPPNADWTIDDPAI